MPAKKKTSVKPVDKKFENIEIHELKIRMEKAEAKVEMAAKLYQTRLQDELKGAKEDIEQFDENRNTQRRLNEEILSIEE